MICPNCGKYTTILIKRKDGEKMCWWCDNALSIPKKNKLVKKVRNKKSSSIRKFHRLFQYGTYKVSYEEIKGDIYRVAIYNDDLELVMDQRVFKMDNRELKWYLNEVLHEAHEIL